MRFSRPLTSFLLVSAFFISFVSHGVAYAQIKSKWASGAYCAAFQPNLAISTSSNILLYPLYSQTGTDTPDFDQTCLSDCSDEENALGQDPGVCQAATNDLGGGNDYTFCSFSPNATTTPFVPGATNISSQSAVCTVPGCSANTGNTCTSGPNACGQTNSGTIECDGNCSANTPPNTSCVNTPIPTGLTATPESCGTGNIDVSWNPTATGTTTYMVQDTGTSGGTRSYVYTDSLQNGFYINGSDGPFGVGSFTLSNTSPTYVGSDSIAVAYDPYGGFTFENDAGVNTSGYSSLSFYVNGGSQSGQEITVEALTNETGDLTPDEFASGSRLLIGAYCYGGQIPSNAWTHCSIPLSDIGAVNANLRALRFQEDDPSTTTPMYFDQMALYTPNSVVYAGPNISFTHTGLVASSTHGYSVAESNSTGTSDYSSIVTATTTGACSPAPDLTAVGTTATPSPGTTGQSETLSTTIENIGTANTKTTYTTFPNVFEIGNGTATTTINAGTVSNPFVIGSSSALSVSYTPPASMTGNYIVRACANKDTQGRYNFKNTGEVNTSNNCDAGQALTIAPPPPSCSTLSASPTTIDLGDSVTLTWVCTHAAHCTQISNSDGFSTQGLVNSNDPTVMPSCPSGPPCSVSYGMTCGGASFQFPQVNVVSPSVSISANPIRVPSPSSNNASTTLTLTSSNVSSCSVTESPGTWNASGSGDANTTVTFAHVQITTQTIFTATCSTIGGGNSVTSSVTVNVGPSYVNF